MIKSIKLYSLLKKRKKPTYKGIYAVGILVIIICHLKTAKLVVVNPSVQDFCPELLTIQFRVMNDETLNCYAFFRLSTITTPGE